MIRTFYDVYPDDGELTRAHHETAKMKKTLLTKELSGMRQKRNIPRRENAPGNAISSYL